MLDTVLNLGLNDASVEGLAKATENERFAWDSYRRFVQMFGNVCHGIPGEQFEDAIKEVKSDRGVKDDTELDVDALKELDERASRSSTIPAGPAGAAAPGDPRRVRLLDRRPRGRVPAHQPHPRRVGHRGQRPADGVRQQGRHESGTGVAFSRDEVTGEPEPSGDFLVNAQGEDVVSGVRNTRDIAELAEVMPEAHEQLMEILRTLERHYKDMQDTEFTVEEGQLYMLQTRNAKRPAQAAVRFACDAVDEELLTKEEALATIDAGSLDALLHPTFDPKAEFEVLASGVSASPGRGQGRGRVHRRRRRGGGRARAAT